MAFDITFIVTPSIEKIRATVANMDPNKRREIVERALVKSGFVVARNAQRQMLNGRIGGPAHPTKLTSRTGTGRRSIRSDRRATRQGKTRILLDIGTDLEYMGLHETGGPWQTATGFRTYPPRPYLRPGLEASKSRIESIFRQEWVLGIRRAGPL